VRIGVLGAGALGLGAALRLAQAGHTVEILEREASTGGLVAGLRVGPSYLEKFYHHLFKTDRAIVSLIEELGLGERLVWARPDTSILVGGQLLGLDSAADVLRFRLLNPLDRLRLGAVAAFLKVLPDPKPLEGVTAARWLRRWMGPRVFDTVWGPLLRGKFHDHAEEIAMPWFWARVHCRSQELGYLRGGFQQLYNRMAERIAELGGNLELGCPATAIEPLSGGPDGRVRVETPAGPRGYDRLVVTLPTRLFLRLARDLPAEYRQEYEHGTDHLSAHCLILSLSRKLTDVYWLSINDPDVPFLSLVEHTNFMPPEDYGGRHLVYLGNYLPPDHPLFSMPEREVRALYLPHLKQLNPSFEESWVCESWSFAAPFAQPIVRVGYPDLMPPHITPLPGVYLANMGHVYPQDRGQNYSLLLGEKVAGLAGKP
jgi:protoporphyrinogen oxidase